MEKLEVWIVGWNSQPLFQSKQEKVSLKSAENGEQPAFKGTGAEMKPAELEGSNRIRLKQFLIVKSDVVALRNMKRSLEDKPARNGDFRCWWAVIKVSFF